MWHVVAAYIVAFGLLALLMLHSIYNFNKTKRELKALDQRFRKKMAK